MFYTTLISTDDLASHLDNKELVIIDCRFDLANTGWGQEQYRVSHIPTARYAHLDNDLSGPVIKGATGRHPLPTVEALVETVSGWGIDEKSQVVAYDQGGGMFAARLWWLLNWLGHEGVAVLDGGWQQWLEDEGLVDDVIPTSKSKCFTPQLHREYEASVEDVEASRCNRDVMLLDARGADRFRGENETIDPIAGHIPGALSAPFMDNLGSDGCFLDKAALQSRYCTLLGETSEVIVYCGSGVTAAHNVLAMVHSGLTRPRLYAGSWSHWITDPSHPVET